MADARPEAAADEEAEAAELTGEALDVEALKARGDVEGLVTLARAARGGTLPGGRDMKRCFAAYLAAAELGHADADFAVALFHLTGSVVAQDLKEGATYLRRAAEKGSVPAKVYLGNLYELGIHYKADPEKADVWYRNAARGARIDEEPGSDEHTRALADLGCARYVTRLVESGTLADDDKARLLQRARAHGYGLRIKEEVIELELDPGEPDGGDRPTFLASLETADQPNRPPVPEPSAPQTPSAQASSAQAKAAKAEAGGPSAKKQAAKSAEAKPSIAPYAFAAFGYAILFALTGLGAAYAASLGARELVARGTPLPGLGQRVDLVFPIVLGVVGILPSWLVYRLGAVVKALVMGAAFAGVGWVAWGTGQVVVHAERLVQALVFGLPGFLGALCILGFLGGTKKQPPLRRRPG